MRAPFSIRHSPKVHARSAITVAAPSSENHDKWVMVPQRSGGATQGKAPMSQYEALRSWRYADGQPTAAQAAQQLAQRWYRGRGGGAATPSRASRAKRPASMAGVCTVAMLLLVVPLFTLEADARGGGFGGHGGGFGGHGGFGGRGGGMGF